MPQRFGFALFLAIAVWLLGFVWGSVVFMTPPLKNVSPIPFVSSNPAISFPILIVWIPTAYFLTRLYLRGTERTRREALKFGGVLAGVNVVLDLLVLVLALGAGFGYFVSLTVWLGYALLFLVPVFVLPVAARE